MSVPERVLFWRRLWWAAPRSFRKVVVFLVGGTLVCTGVALVVLPGPFTVPLVLAGLAVLSSEFLWAARLLEQGRRRAQQGLGLLRRRRGKRP